MVAALTVAYDILVGGLLVPIIGGLVWRRGTGTGALAAMGIGTVATLVTMFVVGDLYANEPVYVGLATGSRRTSRAAWPRARRTPRCWRSGTRAPAPRWTPERHRPRSRPMTSFMISVAPP